MLAGALRVVFFGAVVLFGGRPGFPAAFAPRSRAAAFALDFCIYRLCARLPRQTSASVERRHN